MSLERLVRSAILDAHNGLIVQGLNGLPPLLNLHEDSTLPPCVYQPRTNVITACLFKLLPMTTCDTRSLVLDSMAMCGCQRDYQTQMRVWNMSQNKARLVAPVLSMQGGPKWRAIRSKLG